MHEQSLMADLMRKIDAVVRENGATRVTGVKVWLGALSHMSPEHFREHFLQASLGSLSEGARLEIGSSDDTTDPRAQDILLQSVEVECPEES